MVEDGWNPKSGAGNMIDTTTSTGPLEAFVILAYLGTVLPRPVFVGPICQAIDGYKSATTTHRYGILPDLFPLP